jgi:hypothetical protein
MCEYQYVVCHLLFSRQDVLDQHIRAVHEKSFTEAGHRRRHENSKQHQLRLMNDGGDDDFFFYNNNRQRQLTISTSSSTTSTTTTAAKRLQCRQCTKSYFTASHLRRHVEAVHFEIRHRCPNCKSTFSSKSNQLDICVRTVSTKAISVRSMSLSGAQLAGRAQVLGTSRSIFASLLQVVRFVFLSVLLLCVGGRFSLIFSICSTSHQFRL